MTSKVFETQKSPYFDDFDSSKNFVNVLFKPDNAVQVRELNQIQSIQHNNLEKFADHIFKHGAMVEGQGPTITQAAYITIQSTNNSAISFTRIKQGAYLKGKTSEVEAKLIHYAASSAYDKNTLYIDYTKTADSGLNTFVPGEIIDVLDSNDNVLYSVKMRCNDCPGAVSPSKINPKGTGTLWFIPEGTYYVYGYFIESTPSILIGEQFTTGTKSYSIGFQVVTDIVTAQDDNTLFDNTLGYPNYSAEGADRGRIRLIPKIKKNDDVIPEDERFVVLAKVENGTPSYIKRKTEYSDIMDMIAERTYDESGNYTVKPFLASIHEHMKRGDNGGLITEAQGGDDSKFVVTLSPGKAYVKGYQVETISDQNIMFEKARDTRIYRNFFTNIKSLAYILIQPTTDSLFIANDQDLQSVYANLEVDLHDGTISGGVATGNVIGKIKPFDVFVHSTATTPFTYKMFFTEINMNEGKKFSEVKSLKRNGTINFLASSVNDSITSKPKIFNGNQTALIWKIRENIKTTRDADNNAKRSLSFSKRKKFYCTLDAAGTFVWYLTAGNEYFSPFNTQTTVAAFINEVDGTAEIITDPNLFTKFSITSERMYVNFGEANAGKKLIFFHTVTSGSAIEKKKTIQTLTETIKQVSATGVITLGKSDIIRVVSLLEYEASNPSVKTPITDTSFVLDNGQRDYGYINGAITLKIVPEDYTAKRYDLVVEYFEHSAGNYFSIDSYTGLVEDKTITFTRNDIPTYKSKNGIEYSLEDCLDFRPLILDAQPILIVQPQLDGQVSTDLEFYLPRIDLVVVNKDGKFFQMEGKSSLAPKPPVVASDGSEMALYEIYQKPYVTEASTDVRVKFVENKRYTMRDIGRLEKRIQNVEYYTTFSLMEMSLAQTSVKDEFGLDRFKNGFLADNFQDFQAASLTSKEFRASVDRTEKTLKPSFELFETGLKYDASQSSHEKLVGNTLMIDYVQEQFISQPYSTKSVSLNPYFVYNKVGDIIMDPPFDNWADIKKKPELVVDVTLPKIETNNPIGINYGSWKNVNVASAKLGEYVTDVHLKTYMRQFDVKFFASGMKKNTVVYPFFDGVSVAKNCRPLKHNSKFGDELKTNSKGEVIGVFRIPKDTFFTGQKTFLLTNSSINSNDEDVLETSADGVFWSGGLDIEKQKTSLNIITPVIKPPRPTAPPPPQCVKTLVQAFGQFKIKNPLPHASDPYYDPSPEIKRMWVDCLNANGGTLAKKSGIAKRVIECLAKKQGITANIVFCEEKFNDPLAQSFKIDQDCFISAVDIFFSEVADGDRVFCRIVSMVNGYPSGEILGEKILTKSEISVSEKANVATKIVFPYPVFVKENTEYSVVVGGMSVDTRVYVSKLGDKDITTGVSIETQPSLGSLFKSQNATTWTASQYEDLKFNLYRCKFLHKTATFSFSNRDYDDDDIKTNPFETQAGSSKVRVYSRNHAMNVGDSFKPRIAEESYIQIDVPSERLSIGQKLTTATGSGTITDIDPVPSSTTRKQIKMKNIIGHFVAGQSFSTDSINITTESHLPNNFMAIEIPEDPSGTSSGTIFETFNPTFNGIPLEKLNKILTVTAVDSSESFITDVGVAATVTGFTGGDVRLSINKKYDVFNISGSYLDHGATSKFNFRGIGHSANGVFSSSEYRRLANIAFEFSEDIYLDQPLKHISGENTSKIKDIATSGANSLNIYCNFTTKNNYTSPVFNIDSLSFIGVSNNVDFNKEITFNVEPNATNRLIPETDPVDGHSLFKYVTRKITLSNPASELKILLDVHKPTYSEYELYVKAQAPFDPTDFDILPWIKINGMWTDFISNSDDEYFEVQATLGELVPTIFDGDFQYISFAIKIVGKTKNSAKPPMFKMLRAIALS